MRWWTKRERGWGSGKRWMTVLLLVGVVLLSSALFKVSLRRWELQRELRSIDETIAKLEEQNKRSSDLLKYLQTIEYAEREARARLGYKGVGEQVAVLEGVGATSADMSVFEPQGGGAWQRQTFTPSNAALWWKYFFGT